MEIMIKKVPQNVKAVCFVLFASLIVVPVLSQTNGLYSPINKVLNTISGGLGNEELWNSVVEDLDEIVDDLEDIDLEDLSFDEKKSVNANIYMAEVLHDFFGELSPYDGRNFDLNSEKFTQAVDYMQKIGVDISITKISTDYKLPLVKVSMWYDNINILLVHNNTNCLHTFEADLGNYGKIRAGVDRQSYRAVTGWTINFPDPTILSFIATESDYRNGCSHN